MSKYRTAVFQKILSQQKFPLFRNIMGTPY